MSEIKTIVKWFEDAKPNPTIEDISTQYGCHLEEFAEVLKVTDEFSAHKEVSCSSESYKSGVGVYLELLEQITECEDSRVELLDAFCDQIVTAVGTAQYMGFDIIKTVEINTARRYASTVTPLTIGLEGGLYKINNLCI